jgi:hypothetical protein
MEQDGQPVEETVSEGTVPAVVEPTTDPVEAKVKELLAKERATIVEEARRASQSQADKTAARLQRELNDERSHRMALEGAFQTLPQSLGPDADPDTRLRMENAGYKARYNAQQQQAFARQQEEQRAIQLESMKRNTIERAKQEIAATGMNPEDARLVWDVETDDPGVFYGRLAASLSKAQKEDALKSIPELVKQAIADEKARERRESGVDSHESAGATAGSKTFTRAQIKDRAFYEANKVDIEKAAKEGRIK